MSEFPKHWKSSMLEECVEILDNKRIPVNADERAKRQGDVPYYGATGQAGWIDDYIFNEELVLLGEDGAPFYEKEKNVAFLINGKSWVNNHAHVLKARDEFTINRFVLHYLNYFDYRGYVGGTTRLKLTQGSLRKIPFPLPPLAEQKRIVAKLDTLFAHLDQLRSRLDKIPVLLKQFRQAVLTQAVTGKLTEEWRENSEASSVKEYLEKKWKNGQREVENSNSLPHGWASVTLQSICERVSVGHVGPTSKYYTSESLGIPFIRSQNVRPGRVDMQGVQYITKEFHATLKKSQLKPGDILVVRVGANRGDAAILPENLGVVNCANIVFARPLKELSRFLGLFFISPAWTSIINQVSTGTAQGVINTSIVASTEIDLPPIEEQGEILRRVYALFQLADVVEKHYRILENEVNQLPQLMLKKAFSGGLNGRER